MSSPYSVSIGSLSDEGELPFYMEKCSSTMAVIPTGGAPTRDEELRKGRYKINVVSLLSEFHENLVELQSDPV